MSGSVKSIRHHQALAGRGGDDAHAQYLLASCGSLGNWDDAYDHSLVTSANPHSVDFNELTGSMPHAALTDRDAVDAHTQYLCLAETADQTMSGNLKMSRKNILDVMEIKSCSCDDLSLYTLQGVDIDACKGVVIKTGNSHEIRAKFCSDGKLDMYGNNIIHSHGISSCCSSSFYIEGCRYIYLTACNGINFWINCDLVMEMCEGEVTINDSLVVDGSLCVDGDLEVCGTLVICELCVHCIEACYVELDNCCDEVLAVFHNGCCCDGEGNQHGGFCAFYQLENRVDDCSHWSHYNIVKRSDCGDVSLCGFYKIMVGCQVRWVKFFMDC